MRRGQAMLETVLAVLFVTFVFLVAHQLTRMLTARILLDHAAARAVRARAVGLNDFMCEKTARAAIIPVAGKRIVPAPADYGDAYSGALDEVSRIPLYMATETPAHARGVLDYEGWNRFSLSLDSGSGFAPTARAQTRLFTEDGETGDSGGWWMDGAAEIESHYPLYMEDWGW